MLSVGVAILLIRVLSDALLVNAVGLSDGYVRTPAVYREKDRAKIANCRAVCLDKFRRSKDQDDDWCYQTPNCNMCWNVCEMLLVEYRVWSPMCGVPDICFPGCVTACDYQKHGSPKGKMNKGNPVDITNNFRVNDDKEAVLEAEWDEPRCRTCQNDSLVYVISRQKRSDNNWQEIIQTSNLKVTMPKSYWNCSRQFKIVAISASGVQAETYVVTNSTDYLGNNDVQRDGFTNHQQSQHVGPSWIPRLVSMQKSSKNSEIEALIAWAPSKQNCGKFEVSWRVLDQAMEVTGHLYTFTHLASLALWPNSLHSVDVNVACFDINGKELERSDALFINSKDAKIREIALVDKNGQCLDSAYLTIVVAIMGSLFLAFLILFVIWIRKIRKISIRNERRYGHVYRNEFAASAVVPSSPIVKQINNVLSNETTKAILNRHKKLVKTISRKLSSISDSKEPEGYQAQVDLLDDDEVFNEHETNRRTSTRD